MALSAETGSGKTLAYLTAHTVPAGGRSNTTWVRMCCPDPANPTWCTKLHNCCLSHDRAAWAGLRYLVGCSLDFQHRGALVLCPNAALCDQVGDFFLQT